jgi:hypothetical protein
VTPNLLGFSVFNVKSSDAPIQDSNQPSSLDEGNKPSYDAIDPTEDSDNELSKEERLKLAHCAWQEANGSLSIKEASRRFGVPFSTLRNRINGASSKELANQAM